MDIKFRNILVIHLGQLGDVILSLPALNAIRVKFPDARITYLGAEIPSRLIEISDIVDEIIPVDRVRLRKGPKLWSITQLFAMVREVRRRGFDFVIDLNSFYESNLLGWLSGAKQRLYANRENRSLDILSNFRPKPPREDKSLHHADRYLAVLKALGINKASRSINLIPNESERREIAKLLNDQGSFGRKLVGLFLGAGHPTRQWGLDNFADLAWRLSRHENIQPLVFMGPEERSMRDEAREKMNGSAVIVDELELTAFFTFLTKLDVLVCGDTGPMHLGAIAGTSLVTLSADEGPAKFLPLTDNVKVLIGNSVSEIDPAEVYSAVVELMKKKAQKPTE